MESEGPSAPTSEDRLGKTLIRLAQLYPALDRPKSTPGAPEETGGTGTGRPTTRTGALARAKETRRLQPARRARGSIFTTAPASLAGPAGLGSVEQISNGRRSRIQIGRDTDFAVGYSNGANIAASLLLLHPQTLSAAVLFRAMPPFEPDGVMDLAGRKVLLASGKYEPIVSERQTSRLTESLTNAGASVTLHVHVGGHELRQDDVGRGPAMAGELAGLETFD